ncbi:hypothetical protein BBO99_00008179 [Phytophthora kernoviae]|uniref:Uncharacterized protein n=2 Tax=Phytophthora kernoviae TaxID=325452 RepID=A0A421GG54_9STRA|nr:hypothetical protein G195_010359 [Phytophthora kernoviae 00238/432]KAG2509868.1 hypothetical protein JM16_008057 [Phytophthora kernoviae]KAG2511723.1 hypothetical protein JM18_008066 [Phytophthora kernoviae]RLN02414.1 hypothetical protein BBI17_008661 [Phytophthora kernoviae]RLN75638.1 hypothetical protein BBO99_00008179 [Phytophthora kernoviae]
MVAALSVNLAFLTAAGLTASVNAHSYMILPLPTWPVSWGTNSPSGTIEGEDYLPVPDGLSYSTDPYDNTVAYWTAFNASNYTSLLEFAKETQVLQTMATFGAATAECGFSLTNGTARDLPAEVEWNQLTSSHEGPCEVWCDDTLVFEDWNCALDYTSDPAKLPYDVSNSSVDASAVDGDGGSSTTSTTAAITTATTSASASTAADASFTNDYATSKDASASASTAPTPITTSMDGSEAASATSEADAATTAPTEASTVNEDGKSTTAAPASITATPIAATVTPSATSSTKSGKCSVRHHRRN